MRSFEQQVQASVERTGSDILLLLQPLMSDMPAPMHFHDDPFFPFSKDIIRETRDVVCGYIFDFAAYMVHGAAGARAMERSIAFAGEETIKILHGSFVGSAYIPMIYENALGANAATIANQTDYNIYTSEPNHGAFIVRHSLSQPKSVNNTTYPTYSLNLDRVDIPEKYHFRVAGKDILYSDYGHDYAKFCRSAIEDMLR